jgi:hypothetical protein
MPCTDLNQKVNTTTKSPKHDGFVVKLIFVVFRCRVCNVSVQKWAIWTWLILFYYQYGSNVAKHKTQPQNTTYNIQHTQHTQQPTNMSRCHPTPSLGCAFLQEFLEFPRICRNLGPPKKELHSFFAGMSRIGWADCKGMLKNMFLF